MRGAPVRATLFNDVGMCTGVADLIDLIPPVNTGLVALVGLLILAGVHQIRRGRVERHRRLMISATTVFAVFLVLYMVRMVVHGPTSFTAMNPTAPGWASTFYYAFLGTHMALALVTVALVPVVLHRARERRWEDHRRLATKVAPLWLVSIIMGIAVYFLLFQTWG